MTWNISIVGHEVPKGQKGSQFDKPKSRWLGLALWGMRSLVRERTREERKRGDESLTCRQRQHAVSV